MTIVYKNKGNQFYPYFKGLSITVKDPNKVESAISKFKRMVNDSGIMRELRKREGFVSKGQKKRLAKLEAIKRHKKNLQKLSQSN